MTTWPNTGNRPFIGNWQWLHSNTEQSKPLIVNGVDVVAFDVNIENGASASRIGEGKTVVYGGWPRISDMCNLSAVQERFRLAKENRANYHYANFLLSEETWGTNYGWGTTSCSASTGSAMLGDSGITIQLKNTWLSANPGKSAADWAIYYQFTLLKAWKLHCASFTPSKGVAIGGFCGTPFSDNQIRTEVYPSNSIHDCLNYVINNYDLIVAYQYPRTVAETSNSLALVKVLRNTYNYNGKVAWILTTDFNEETFNWNWNADVAYTEYKTVAPYVDYIISYAHTSFKNHASDYPAILKVFYNQYNPVCVPVWVCETPLNGYENDGCEHRRLNSVCNPKYKCSGAPNYQCISDVSGTYDTLAACQAACQAVPPPNPDDVTARALLGLILGMITAYFILVKEDNNKKKS